MPFLSFFARRFSFRVFPAGFLVVFFASCPLPITLPFAIGFVIFYQFIRARGKQGRECQYREILSLTSIIRSRIQTYAAMGNREWGGLYTNRSPLPQQESQ